MQSASPKFPTGLSLSQITDLEPPSNECLCIKGKSAQVPTSSLPPEGGSGNCLSGKKKAHKHKLFGPGALGTPRECPRDKPGLSRGQSGFVPGTNPGFLLILHSGSPVRPWDKPSLSLGHSGDEGRQKEFMC